MEQMTEALQTAHSPTAPEPLRAQALQVGGWFGVSVCVWLHDWIDTHRVGGFGPIWLA